MAAPSPDQLALMSNPSVPGHFIDDHCAYCDTELHPRVEALFCGDCCAQTADFVRYARNVVADGRVERADVQEALRTRMAFLVVGGYPETARRLTHRVRAAVMERDGGRCVLCGGPGTEIDHMAGHSDDLSNLRLLCHECHQSITDSHMVAMAPEHIAIKDAIWARVNAQRPTRLCDDEHEWKNHWRRLKTERRQRLLALLENEFNLTRNDFPTGTTWAEMWNQVTDVGEFGDLTTGTIEDYEHHMYLRDLAQRDD
jgi:5-methylcytosine-specific restriction endonuclease McrA